MKVGVGPHFHGFTIDLVQKGAVLCHILNMHLKTKFQIATALDMDILKMGHPKTRTFHCGKAVAFPNEKYNYTTKY